MSAPSHVRARVGPAAYRSPPRRADQWRADRPGEVVGHGQPTGGTLGNQGPDQGYVWRLMRRFRDQLVLGEGEDAEDAMAGCVAVALRRASMFSRAPVVHDVRVALTVFGYLDRADAGLVGWRRELFAGVSDPHHHYATARRIAELVPEEVLRLPPDAVSASFARDLQGPLGRRDAARSEHA